MVKRDKNTKKRVQITCISEKSSTFAADLESVEAKQEAAGAVRLPEKSVYTYKIKMYAIVEINGQQFKAEEGKKLFVNHICGAENGQTVEFDNVLLIDNNGDVKVGAPTVEGAKVVCEVVSSLVKGDKVLVFHKKRRKGYRKLNGYRHQFTEVTIKNVIA